MSSVQYFKGFVNERLSAAAEEIFRVFENIIFDYEEEIDRQRKLMDDVWKPDVHRIELPQQHVCQEEEDLTNQQLCVQERSSSLDQEDPEPPQIKEEQEQLCTSQEGEQLDLKQGTETLMTSTYEEFDHSEQQLLFYNSYLAGSQDQKRGKNGDSGAARYAEPNPQSRSHSESTLQSHMSKHTVEKPYLCKSCGKRFCAMPALKRHMTVHTELSQQHVCQGEEEEDVNDQQLCVQERSSSVDQEDPEPPQIKDEQEQLCTSQEGEQLDLKQGTETLMTSTYDKLDHSEHHLLFYNSYLAGIQDQKRGNNGDSGAARNAEPNPQSRSHSESTLQSHMSIHTDEKPYLCKICGKRFCAMPALKRHMTIHSGEKPYLCKICEKRFRDISEFKRHMSVHTGEKPHACETCGKAFRLGSALKIHMRIHTGEKPYLCKTCEKRFSDSSVFKRHMSVHTGEKPHTCETCGKTFRRGNALKVHMRIHTGEKPYLCNTCGKGFAYMSVLKNHILTHTG